MRLLNLFVKMGNVPRSDKFSCSFQQRAKKVIESHNSSTPLFLYMAFQNVHIPLQVPKRYSDKYSFIDDEDRRTYAGMVDILDEAVGNITQAMKDAGYNNCFAYSVIFAAVQVVSHLLFSGQKSFTRIFQVISLFNTLFKGYRYN